MTTTFPVAAQAFSDSHSDRGGDGLNPHGAQTQDEGHPRYSAVGTILPDPAQWIPEGHRCNGRVGDPSAVNAQETTDSHSCGGVDGPTPPVTSTEPVLANQALACPEGPTSPAAPIRDLKAMGGVAPLVDPFLALSAEILDDFEKVRIANENRLRQLTRDVADVDGEERGFGLTLENPDVAKVVGHVRALLCTSVVTTELGIEKTERRKRGCCREHDAERDMTSKMRAHPLGPWVTSTVGVGDKQAARLLASIGDPAWHHQDDRPRTLRELWSYCGYGDPETQVRRRGQRINWDPSAKMRTHLIAVSCMKALGSPFRTVYDDAKARYADAVHQTPCKRCGPSGKPAEAGSPLSASHQHGRALRAVSKELLRALWIEARRIHELETS